MLKRLDPSIRPQFFRVRLELDPARKDFKGVVEIDVRFERAVQVLDLHAQGLIFEAVSLKDGAKPVAAMAMGDDSRGLSWFDFGRSLGPGVLTFSFSYRANFATGLEGAYKTKTGKRSAIFTQFEAIGARRVMPCFDEPGFKAAFEMVIVSPSWATVVANARTIETRSAGKFSTHRFAPTPPLPSYLVAFAVGEFDVVDFAPIAVGSQLRAPIALRGIAQKGRGDEMNYVLSITERLVHTAEDYFGIAYPFDKLDIIAAPDFAAGGMENVGAIVYDEGYVLLDDDPDLDRKRDMLALHAHELVHQWFGNLVNPAWWDDLWLNESFATLLEAKFSDQIEPRWHFSTDVLLNAHGAMVLDLLPSVRRVHEPVNTEDGISTAFDSITYEKGSVILAMVEAVLGETAFRNFISTFLLSRKFGSYDTAGFVRELRNCAKGPEAADLLLSLIDHTGIPIVNDVARAFPADAVPRYHRAKLSEALWLDQCKIAASLPLPQALAIAMSFDVSFYASEMSLRSYLAGVHELCRHPMWDVAGLALENLEFILLELPEKSRVKDFSAQHFSPLFVTVPPGTDMEVHWQMDWRETELADFFAVTRCNEDIFQQLMADGLRLLKEDDPFEAAYPEARLVPALVAAARGGETWVFQSLVSLLDEIDDVHYRGHVIEALCASPSTGVDAKLETMLRGGTFRANEIPTVLEVRARYPEFRPELWAMVSRNAEPLLARLDGDMDVALIQVADAFTTLALARNVEASITPLLGRLRGGIPQLALTLDKIRLNAALLKHLRQETGP